MARVPKPLTVAQRKAKAARDRRYRLAHAEEIREKKRVYRAATAEYRRSYTRRWYRDNLDRARKARKARYWADPQKARDYSRQWLIDNPEKALEAIRQYRAANPEPFRERRRRYKARKVGIPHESWTTLEILERDGWTCLIPDCRCPDGRAIDPASKPNTNWQGVVDHIQPISKGGPDLKINLQAAHRACNATKCDRWDDEMVC